MSVYVCVCLFCFLFVNDGLKKKEKKKLEQSSVTANVEKEASTTLYFGIAEYNQR